MPYLMSYGIVIGNFIQSMVDLSVNDPELADSDLGVLRDRRHVRNLHPPSPCHKRTSCKNSRKNSTKRSCGPFLSVFVRKSLLGHVVAQHFGRSVWVVRERGRAGLSVERARLALLPRTTKGAMMSFWKAKPASAANKNTDLGAPSAPRLHLSLSRFRPPPNRARPRPWVAPLPDHAVFGTAPATATSTCCGGSKPPPAERASWWCW